MTKPKTKSEPVKGYRPIRLTADDRRGLVLFARTILVTPAEEAAEAAAHAKVAAIIAPHLTAPAEDMAILRKYRGTRQFYGVRFESTGQHRQNEHRFCLRDVRASRGPGDCGRGDANRILVEGPAGWSFHGGYMEANTFLPDDVRSEAAAALREYFAAAAATDAARKAVLNSIADAATASKTLQEVADLWPPAMQFAPRLHERPVVPAPERKVRIDGATWLDAAPSGVES